MTVTGRCPDGGLRAFAKGAPEAILPLCAFVQTDSDVEPLTPAMRREMLLKSEFFAADGLSMLAFACREVSCGEDPEQNLVFFGLAGLRDTVFPDAPRAVARWRAAQVHPVLVGRQCCGREGQSPSKPAFARGGSDTDRRAA